MDGFGELARQCHRRADTDNELYGEIDRSRSQRWDAATVESSELERDAGAGLRLHEGQRIGMAYANQPGLDAGDLTDRAQGTLELMESDPHLRLADPSIQDTEDTTWYDPSINNSSGDRARQVEALIQPRLESDDVKTLQVSLTERLRHVSLFREGNRCFRQSYTRFQLGVWAVCGDGDNTETGYEHQTAVSFGNLELERVFDEAVKRGRRQLSSEPPDSRSGPAVLTARAASGLLKLARRMLDGEAVVNGRSAWSSDRIDDSVGNERINLVDDPGLERGGANVTFDAEGYRLGPSVLVENGQYVRCLGNDYLTRRSEVPVVHRASRRYRSRPGVGSTNFYLEPGDATFEDLIRELGEGPVVTDIQPGSGLDTVSGHFSVGAKGYFVHNGQFQRPFTEGTISGTLEELLGHVRSIGERLPAGYGTASPPVLVDTLSLGGSGSAS